MESQETYVNHKPIAIAHDNGFYVLNPEEIIRIETASSRAGREKQPVNNGFGSYTYVYLQNGKSICVRKQICDWMVLLSGFQSSFPGGDFFKPHQSHIVNLSYISNITTVDGYQIRLHDSCLAIPVARSRVSELKGRFGL